mmetsp:Transcript_21208/g.55288  ORF Transcript_21208/g.55288 Transcript_21208/m.55288 type:complete len:233 (-) Transcript_21208:341-1039(-)
MLLQLNSLKLLLLLLQSLLLLLLLLHLVLCIHHLLYLLLHLLLVCVHMHPQLVPQSRCMRFLCTQLRRQGFLGTGHVVQLQLHLRCVGLMVGTERLVCAIQLRYPHAHVCIPLHAALHICRHACQPHPALTRLRGGLHHITRQTRHTCTALFRISRGSLYIPCKLGLSCLQVLNHVPHRSHFRHPLYHSSRYSTVCREALGSTAYTPGPLCCSGIPCTSQRAPCFCCSFCSR